ncbi:hypothetical protein [Pirellula sp. SH-Sr6A]|uniref:hypothetical protein n=1 Tax=Pirellula sp. SH-Sr6A TaxID=1632865 RepID=UPI0011BAD8B4|nr:hypothetical protein [Pirellula sp. SH-Sr6A]
MITPWLLPLLRCPITSEPLLAADPSLVAELQLLAESGRIKTKVGGTLSAIPPQGLVNASKGWFYPIHGEVGDLLAEDAIQIPENIQSTEPC